MNKSLGIGFVGGGFITKFHIQSMIEIDLRTYERIFDKYIIGSLLQKNIYTFVHTPLWAH